jgi:2-methylfumaryl-CoA isomerase
MQPPRDQLLAGLRVVEVSAFVAAPLAGATLAGLGADVVRVEQLGGGIDARRWPVYQGRSLYREGLDRGKRLVAVDLRSARGQALVLDLVAAGEERGGILVTNLPARGWMAYERLVERRPDLVMVVIEGTRDGGSAVDYTVNAGAGFPFVTGRVDAAEPVNHALPAWDIAAGELAAIALLAAERRRHLTGAGGLVQIALADVALEVARSLGYIEEARLIGEPRPRVGNAIYGTYGRDFRTADGRFVMVCALTVRQWEGLTEAIGATPAIAALEAATGADLREEGARYEHREAIDKLVGAWIGAHELAEVGATFDRCNVLWGPYRSFKELLEDPRVAEAAGSPVRVGGRTAPPHRPTSAIGADTEAVLRLELGLDDEAVARLRATGVID